MPSSLVESVRSFERWRKSLIALFGLAALAAFVGLGALAERLPLAFWQHFGFPAGRPPWFLLWPGILVLALGVGYLASYWGALRYRFAFKNQVIQRIVKSVDPSLTYEPALGIGQDDFIRSRLFFIPPNWYQTEDQIRGRVGSVAFTAAEINAEYRKVDSKGEKEADTIFCGLFVKIDRRLPLTERVLVLPDDVEFRSRTAAKILQSFDITRPGRVVRFDEDHPFEEVYAVYASSEDEARRLLTPSLRRALTSFREKTYDSISIAFHPDAIYVAIAKEEVGFALLHTTELKAFEPNLWRSLNDVSALEAHADDVRSILSLVQTVSQGG